MLRHSTGSELADAGAAVDVVQELLGHRYPITSTQVYVHPSRARMRKAVEAVEAVAVKRRAERRKQP
jgi:site-specific recombinase XerD